MSKKKEKCPTCKGKGWVVHKDVFMGNDSYDEPRYSDQTSLCYNCVLQPVGFIPNPEFKVSDFFKNMKRSKVVVYETKD